MDKIQQELQSLAPHETVGLLRRVAAKWLNTDGLQAFAIYSQVQEAAGKQGITFPSWLDEQSTKVPAELVQTSLHSLICIAAGKGHPARAWLEDEIRQLNKPQAHAFDPASLTIIGLTTIGCILAARIRRIGPVEFYEGVPKELADAMKPLSKEMLGLSEKVP